MICLYPEAASMLRQTLTVWTLTLSLCVAGQAGIAAEARPEFDCADPLKSVPGAINHTLGGLYHSEPLPEQLLAASEELRQLVLAATNCRVYAQSPTSGSAQELVTEWYGLNLWITRLADFLYLNAKGKVHVNWKIEYADFAELYGFEI
jgi:hypothetical protein